MILKYAQLQGVSALEMADRLGEFAPALADSADDLDGAMKVMNSLGSFGEEGDTYAKLMSLGGRFTTGFGDLSGVGSMAKGLLTLSGTTAGIAGLTGVTATTLGGIELDGPNGPTAVNWHIPGVSDWYEEHLATPMTGAISTGAANVVADVATVTVPAVGIPLQAYRLTHGGW